MGAQVAGGLFGGATYVLISGNVFNLGPCGEFTWLGVVTAELVYTFVLCYVVLAVATVDDMSHSKDTFGLAIGFAVVAGGYSIGGVSGACFNPAVSFAIDATWGMIKVRQGQRQREKASARGRERETTPCIIYMNPAVSFAIVSRTHHPYALLRPRCPRIA